MTVLTREFLESLNTKIELMEVETVFFKQDAEGSLGDRFLAGIINALSMIDEGTLDKNDDAGFKRIALSEVRNFSHD